MHETPNAVGSIMRVMVKMTLDTILEQARKEGSDPLQAVQGALLFATEFQKLCEEAQVAAMESVSSGRVN